MSTYYCTYCSSKKRPDAGDLPAVERYDSERIHGVESRAREDGAGFLILSGKFGLLRPEDPIPYYDHLLRPDEVERMAGKVADQLKEIGVGALIYFSAPVETVPEVRPYFDTIRTACRRDKISMEIRYV